MTFPSGHQHNTPFFFLARAGAESHARHARHTRKAKRLIAAKKQFIFALKNRSGILPQKGEQTVINGCRNAAFSDPTILPFKVFSTAKNNPRELISEYSATRYGWGEVFSNDLPNTGLEWDQPALSGQNLG